MAVSLNERETLVARAFFRRYKPSAVSNDTWTTIAEESNITNGNVGRNAKFAFNNLITKLGGGGSGSSDEAGDSAETSTPGKKGGAAAAGKPKGVTKPRAPAKGRKGKAAAASAMAGEDATMDQDVKPEVKEELDVDDAASD